MEAATEKILAALEQAIKAEVDGHHFYQMAAQSTKDPKGRTVFERLGADEVAHARFLQAQYDAVSKTGILWWTSAKSAFASVVSTVHDSMTSPPSPCHSSKSPANWRIGASED